MAILKRRKPRSLSKKFKESVWPTMGWWRTMHYYRHRMFRTGDSTYRITAGLAAGASVCFTPFLGTHFMQAALFSWMLRGNIVAGLLGTALGNPWTFPFIFWLTYKTGAWLCSWIGLTSFAVLPDSLRLSMLVEDPGAYINDLFAHPLHLLLPLTLGGYLWGIALWPVFYGLMYYPVRVFRRAYLHQRHERRRKRREKHK